MRTGLQALARGWIHPGRCPMCGPTLMRGSTSWLRDTLLCARCGSVPRQRALVVGLERHVPGWRTQQVYESSPSARSTTGFFERECPGYQVSQWFPDVASGEHVDGVRREDLQALTFDDASLDVVVTQDVFEHVHDPDAAWAEIGRVLRPGGAHVWTVPIFSGRETVQRARPDGAGGVELLMEADFHGDPISDGALVVHEWGDDVVARADRASGLTTSRLDLRSFVAGIRGEMHDVLVSRKG